MELPLNQAAIIDIFSHLGDRIKSLPPETLESLELNSANENPWFTQENIQLSFDGLQAYLNKDDLSQWAEKLQFASTPKKVGLVMAGNVPLVGFHDMLVVLLSGNVALIKMSSKDSVLMRFVLDELMDIEPSIKTHFEVAERLSGMDAVIATGSDNSARYIEYYFGKYPHVIRKNRSSVAVLTGKESAEELNALGKDIFSYFGLGCRNVSKVYVPDNYKFDPFFEAIEPYGKVVQLHKYTNNYDYNKSILLINGVKHLDNGFLLLQESESLVSPISVLFYEQYTNSEALSARLEQQSGKIQCVVGKGDDYIAFGAAQQPTLWDFADGIDTRNFLNRLANNN